MGTYGCLSLTGVIFLNQSLYTLDDKSINTSVQPESQDVLKDKQNPLQQLHHLCGQYHHEEVLHFKLQSPVIKLKLCKWLSKQNNLNN